MTPRVDVIIACHDPRRPLARAVASVVDGNSEARVTIVAHNIAAEPLLEVLDPRHVDRVRVIEHHDGVRSPSGPFNRGMQESECEFVSIMGSDDQLEPGAVRSWLEVQRQTGAQFVMTRLALGTPSAVVPTPPARPFHKGARDLVRDRLAYRSAPLGLMATDLLRRDGFALEQGLPAGGDVLFTLQLAHGWRVAVDRKGPAYVIGTDAEDRVTYVVRKLADQFGFLTPLLDGEWFAGLAETERAAIVTKLLRIHLFGAVFYRDQVVHWTPEERAELVRLTRRIVTEAPRAVAPLSRADRALLDACLGADVPAEVLIERAKRRRQHLRLASLVPRELGAVLHREAPLRFMAASVLTKWGI